MPEGAAKEHDALDRWFNSRRKLWWRSWRWVVLLAWILLIGSLVSGLAGYAYMAQFSHYGYYRGGSPGPLRAAALLWQARGIVLAGSFVTLWVAATQVVRALTMPAEVAITTGPQEIYARTLRRARSEFYRILGWPLVLVAMFLALFFGNLARHMLSFAGGGTIAGAMIGIGVFMFAAEWQIALLLRFPPRLGLNWLYLLPFIHIPVTLFFDWLYRYAPPEDSDITNQIGSLATVVVAFGLFGGAALGRWLWRYLLHNSTMAGHLIMAGLLSSITQIRGALDTTSGPGQLFAWLYVSLFHGAALGNPIAGWTSGGITTQTVINGGIQYGPAWAANPNSYQPFVGMYVLPEVFVPVGAALLWIAAYYVISVWAIRSAVSVMPKGYTGTWQS